MLTLPQPTPITPRKTAVVVASKWPRTIKAVVVAVKSSSLPKSNKPSPMK